MQDGPRVLTTLSITKPRLCSCFPKLQNNLVAWGLCQPWDQDSGIDPQAEEWRSDAIEKYNEFSRLNQTCDILFSCPTVLSFVSRLLAKDKVFI